MSIASSVDVPNMRKWARTGFKEFASMCCDRPDIGLVTDPDAFSMTQRVVRMGSATIADTVVGSDITMECGEECTSYRVVLLQSGRTECVQWGKSLAAGPGTAIVYAPSGLGTARWSAASTMTCFKVRRSAVDEALADALGREVPSRIDFTPLLPVAAAETRSWINMLLLFKEQIFRPDSLLNQPLVAAPYVDSLIRGFLLAAEHSHRGALTRDERTPAPRAIRAAIDIIEAEAHLPLTLSVIARRSHISVRALQQGFRRHLATTPTEYLRQVRLRRAHTSLVEADPSTASVSSVAYHWGFTNLGRFAAMHSLRYGESPAVTLRRSRIRSHA